MSELILRFFIGGLIVSAFALLGDMLRPKSFAGLLGAAPSVALASAGLTLKQHGAAYLAIESRSMIIGAFAFLCYAWLVGQLLKRSQITALKASALAMPAWFTLALGILWAARLN